MYRHKYKKGQEKREKHKLLSILLPFAMLVPLSTVLKGTIAFAIVFFNETNPLSGFVSLSKNYKL